MRREAIILLGLAGAIGCGVSACAGEAEMPPSNTAARERIALPRPQTDSDVSIERTLRQRRSVREFRDQPLDDTQLGQLLWAAQGVTSRDGDRTAPSAGALFPLELYVALAEGLYRYQPKPHRLVRVNGEDLRPALWRAGLEQEALREAPAVFVVTMVVERLERKYGKARSPRYAHLEAGHAAQNLLLQAAALGLGGVPVGAFEDARVARALGLPSGEKPLYLIPVGKARAGR